MADYKFFSNRDCEYFPCHNTDDDKGFNCLFCFCPLYALGASCGGNFSYTSEGIKDCKDCMIPHSKAGYDFIISKWDLINELAKKNNS